MTVAANGEALYNPFVSVMRFTRERRGHGPRALLAVWCLMLGGAAIAWAQAPPATAEIPQSQPASAPAEVPQTQPSPAPEAADDALETAATALSAEEIRARMAQIESATDLSDTVKTELLTLYRQATEQVDLAETWRRKTQEYASGREAAPALIAKVEAELAEATSRPASQPATQPAADVSMEQLAQRLSGAEAELRAREEAARALDTEAENRGKRTVALPDLLADATKRLEAVNTALAAPTAGKSPRLALAQRAALSAQKAALEQEFRAYEAELAFYNARTGLLSARRRLAELKSAEARALVDRLRAQVAERRQLDAGRQLEQAHAVLQEAPDATRTLAETNAQLATELSGLDPLIRRVAARAAELNRQREVVGADLKKLRAQVEEPLVSGLLGPALREAYVGLYQAQSSERDLRLDRAELQRVQRRILEIDDRRVELTDLDGAVAAELERLREQSPEPIDAETLQPLVRDRLARQRELLDSLKRDYETYKSSLIQVATAESGLQARVEEFRTFVEAHILWVRSSAPLHRMRIPRDWRALGPQTLALGNALIADARQQPWLYVLPLLALAALVLARGRLRRWLDDINQRVAKPYLDRHGLTSLAVLILVMMALPIPLLLVFLGWRVSLVVDPRDQALYEYANALGLGLVGGSRWLAVPLLVWLASAPHGLAERHFRWSSTTTQVIRRHLWWLIVVLVPCAVVVMATERLPDEVWRESLGRLSFIVAMLSLALFAWPVLSPSRGVFAAWLRKRPNSWVQRTRWVWFNLGVCAPLAFALTAASGYYFTALALTGELKETVWLLLTLLLIHQLLIRWLLVAQRHLAIEQARKRRAAQAEAAAAAEAKGDAALVEVPPPVEEQTFDLVTIGEHTRQLLRVLMAFSVVVGLAWVWSDQLPALRFLDNVQLWSYTVQAAAGSEAAATIRYVTLRNLLVAVAAAIATYAIARNIPGLLEITVLNRLPMDAGGRFAATTIARYAIVVVGVVIVTSILGLQWSSIQWLVTAMLVGLGFGLQEIFANFVSGLVLLFERPIRIGDTVTVGDTSGVVTRIQIRATTITDWDRKELIIPNREFITGRVVNWTLNDPTLRITLPVGIAYGSDTDRAESILTRIAREDPQVLQNPAPMILFMGFGDSTLNYELRVYLPSVDYLLATRHRLNRAIDREFRKAGVEIAFPQRDLHIRTVQEPFTVLPPHDADEIARARTTRERVPQDNP